MPKYAAYVQKGWEEDGITALVVVRDRGDGAFDVASFELDLLCLGVRDAVDMIELTQNEVDDVIDGQFAETDREALDPACAKKLLFGAVGYAESLGFLPHRDFKAARKILSGIDEKRCTRNFTFGQDGKPCYVVHPDDTEAQINKIMNILDAKCGPGGYVVVEDEEEDFIDSREELMDFFMTSNFRDLSFYKMSGTMAAHLICPEVQPPSRLIEEMKLLPRLGGDQEEIQDFLNLVSDYWNELNDLMMHAISPKAHPDDEIIDVWSEDFLEQDEDDARVAALNEWALGFTAAVASNPSAWARVKADKVLAAHLDYIALWTDPENEKNLAAIQLAGETVPKRTLSSTVKALTKALRGRKAPPPTSFGRN